MAHKNMAQHEFKLLAKHKHWNTLPSCTVPDETLTIKEIVDKHIRGQRIAEEMYRTPVYDEKPDLDNEDLSKVQDMDLFDKEVLKTANAEKIAEMQEKQKTFFKEKEKKKKRDDERASEQGGAQESGPDTSRARKFGGSEDEKEAKRTEHPKEPKKGSENGPPL